MRLALAVATLFVLLAPLAARAETCPDVPDDEVAVRRSLAKEWFAKAEEAEASGDRQGAIRRYACSLALAPHPSTAYNLGTVAEKSGDLAAALDGFRAYLKLAPEATDRPAIEARIAALDAKMTELRKQIAPKAAPDATGAVAATPPAPTPAAIPAAPPTPPPAPRPADVDQGHGKRVAGWIVGASAAAALGTGVVFNAMARSKMSTCYSQYAAGKPGALGSCDDAKPLAYTSYALFGVAGAAGVASALLFYASSSRGAADEAPDVALAPMPGGAALVATGRF
jgi:tetratricopeptide (TPR) repeat protein